MLLQVELETTLQAGAPDSAQICHQIHVPSAATVSSQVSFIQANLDLLKGGEADPAEQDRQYGERKSQGYSPRRRPGEEGLCQGASTVRNWPGDKAFRPFFLLLPPPESGSPRPGRRMPFTSSCSERGFWMEQTTLPTSLSVTKSVASTWKSPAASWVSDSEEDGRAFPLVSLHCTLGAGNQPPEAHSTLILLFSGPVM